MAMLNILTALFVMVVLYGTGRNRFQVVIGLAAFVIAPAAYGIIDGVDGLVFSIVGASAALFLTLPLSLLGFVSRTDVIISIALGGILGAIHYAIAFGIAMAFLSIQRIFRIESSASDVCSMHGVPPYGAGLLAFDEKSALVEIEAMRILRMDRSNIPAPSPADGCVMDSAGESGGHTSVLPWCAKLAVATIVVLMMGTSF